MGQNNFRLTSARQRRLFASLLVGPFLIMIGCPTNPSASTSPATRSSPTAQSTTTMSPSSIATASGTNSQDLPPKILQPLAPVAINNLTNSIIPNSAGLLPSAGPSIAIGAVSSLLTDAIKSVGNVAKIAGGEAKTAGDSLQVNALAVVAEIDGVISRNTAKTFEQLTDQEKQLFNDSLKLISQLQTVSMMLTKSAGQEARMSIQEADILAYNSAYLLPCRSQVPRIVYSSPQIIAIGKDAPEVKLRGNFLNIGDQDIISVNGTAAPIIARNGNELHVRIPDSVINSLAGKDQESISISTTFNQLQRTAPLCSDKIKRMAGPISASALVVPRPSYEVSGVIFLTKDIQEEKPFSFHPPEVKDDDCDASYDSNGNFPIPEQGWIIDGEPRLDVISANCNSRVGPAVVAPGGRSIIVSAHLGGCGTVKWVPSISWGQGKSTDCRGRGWFEYSVTVNTKRYVPKPDPDYSFTKSSVDGMQTTFSFIHPMNNTPMQNPRWKWKIRVIIRGGKQSKIVELNDALQSADGVSGQFSPGVLAVSINNN